jgi:hypothetical protein
MGADVQRGVIKYLLLDELSLLLLTHLPLKEVKGRIGFFHF